MPPAAAVKEGFSSSRRCNRGYGASTDERWRRRSDASRVVALERATPLSARRPLGNPEPPSWMSGSSSPHLNTSAGSWGAAAESRCFGSGSRPREAPRSHPPLPPLPPSHCAPPRLLAQASARAAFPSAQEPPLAILQAVSRPFTSRDESTQPISGSNDGLMGTMSSSSSSSLGGDLGPGMRETAASPCCI